MGGCLLKVVWLAKNIFFSLNINSDRNEFISHIISRAQVKAILFETTIEMIQYVNTSLFIYFCSRDQV